MTGKTFVHIRDADMVHAMVAYFACKIQSTTLSALQADKMLKNKFLPFCAGHTLSYGRDQLFPAPPRA